MVPSLSRFKRIAEIGVQDSFTIDPEGQFRPILGPKMAFRFIAGTDDFLVQRKAQEEWGLLSSGIEDPNALEIVDGQAGNVEEVGRAVTEFVTAVQTISMFSPQKAVWFKGVNFLADSVTGRAQGTTDQVERLQVLLKNYDQENVRVLISATPVDRRKKAYKWFQANGESLFLETGKDDSALLSLIQKEAASAGARFTGNAAQILIDLIGGNTRLALEETRKLCTWLGAEGGKIPPELVAELVPNIGESDFFEAAEAFYSLNLEWALAAVHRHFFAGHDARPLLSSLQNRNRILIQLKALESSGQIRGRVSKSALETAASQYGAYFADPFPKSSFCVFSQNPWYLGKLADCLPRLSLRHLLEFQQIFRDVFLEIIDRPQEQEAVLRAAVVRCLSPLQQVRA